MALILITISILLVLLFLAAKKIWKKDLVGDLVVSFLLGFFWEVRTNTSWNYNTERMNVFYFGDAEIPIEILLAWSLVLSSASLMTHIIQKQLKWHSKFSFFLIGLCSIFVLGFASEVIGVTGGLWGYPENIGVLQVGPLLIPLRVAFGWMFFGITFLTVVKYYEHVVGQTLERNFKKMAK